MISFYSNEKELGISFSFDVVRELQKYRQTIGTMEAGGLLFTDAPNSNRVVITHASLPSHLDIRRWSLFKINAHAARRTITEQFKSGRHYVGEWHTHPQANPRPSGVDERTINALFNDSEHELNYLILAIVSSTSDFLKSYVALTDGNSLSRCNAAR